MNQSERLRRFDRFYERVHRRIVEEIIRPSAEWKALDAGCGAGGMTALLAAALERGLVVGLDPNLEHLAATREQADRSGASNRVIVLAGDVEKLQFLGGEFDLIWCSRVIHHHLPDPQPALSEMYRVLKPGGRLFLRENSNADFAVSIPSLDIDVELSARLRAAATRWFQSKFKSRRPDSDEWLRRMQQAGFDDVRMQAASFEAPQPRYQLTYVQSWLGGVLEDHESPQHGNLLDAGDLDRVRRAIASIEQCLEKPDTELDRIDIYVENPNPVFFGKK